MRRRDDRLAKPTALLDHELLVDGDRFGWNFDAQIATRNHDSVGFFDDGIQILDGLGVFHLGEDENVFAAMLFEELSDLADIVDVSDKRSRAEVDMILAAENEVGFILLGKIIHGKMGPRAIDSSPIIANVIVENFHD